MTNLAFLVGLHSIDGLGSVRIKNLLDYFRDPKLAWEANSKEFKTLSIPEPVIDKLVEARKRLDPEEYLAKVQKSGIRILTFFDENYPKSLKLIYDPPLILYYKGEILPKDDTALGIVGTRKITGYGQTVTERFAKELSEAGLTIVSGLARGVDTVAHKSTIEAGGRTLAILGGGLNKIFPSDNIQLAAKIASGFGAVITEFPPAYQSLAGNFPARNRIISGMSLGVLVTEAARDSGSLITARLALEQGREVFAIPGPITSDLSEGPASLIKEGARLVTNSQEILDDLGISSTNLKVSISTDDFSRIEKEVLAFLENEQSHIDAIVRNLKITSAQVSAALIKMEIIGLVKNLGGGIYLRVK